MKCPFCGYAESKVVDTRPNDDGSSIRRRRECLACTKRFTTYETVERTPFLVVKKDGSREAFDRAKVMKSILRACAKRPVPLQEQEQMADAVEQQLQNDLTREVSTRMIGDLLMTQLKQRDEVAYVRFASVYRRFTDISDFMDELKMLLTDK
jgi:transcriptional repressor NrdR